MPTRDPKRWPLKPLLTTLVAFAVGALVAGGIYLAVQNSRQAGDDREALEKYEELLAGCARGNDRSEKINDIADILSQFLDDAAEIRKETALSQPPSTERRLNLRAFRRWSDWADDVEPLEIVVCTDEYERP